MKHKRTRRGSRANPRWREHTGATYARSPRPPQLDAAPTRESITELMAAAERGESWALVNLGTLYQEGARDRGGRRILKRDVREAARCMRRAAALGDVDGILGLADLLSATRTARGLLRAAPLYRAAYRRGDHTAAFNLACTYQNLGRYRDAVRWFKRALAAGDPCAAMELARAELYGLGTRRHVRSALTRLRAIASGRTNTWPPDADRIEAILVIADALITGWPAPRDYDEGIRWLRRAAALGSAVAKALLEQHGVPIPDARRAGARTLP